MDGDGDSNTGGSGGSGSGDESDDNDISGLWGFLDNIIERITSVWETLTSLPKLIAESLGLGGFFEHISNIITNVWNTVKDIPQNVVSGIASFFASIGETLTNVWNAILELPNTISSFLTSLFVPDTGYIQGKFDLFIGNLKSNFNVNTDVFETLFDSEATVEDEYIDYNVNGVGTMNLKVFDSSFLIQGVLFFRPFIRGFLILLMLLYHVKQLIGFFGYDAGVIAGRIEHINESRKSQKGD